MATFAVRSCALGICAATALLAGCGGWQPPIEVPGAVPQTSVIAPARAGARRTSSPWSFLVLHRFSGGSSDGAVPAAGLISVRGTFYGTTYYGGVLHCPMSCGVVYGIGNGTEKVLHRFKSDFDGAWPGADLIEVKGRLYGTTVAGGGSPCTLGGCGTVYSIGVTGDEKVLYRFTGGADGEYPTAGLIDVNGGLYGTTSNGGASNAGIVYSISSSGSEKLLYSFTGGSDGAGPRGDLVDVNGGLYGTTINGGASNCAGGCGTVYSISTSGKEQVLYRFTGGSDGANPYAGLIEMNGKLYGTTSAGGGSGCYNYGCGTVFSITTAGAENVLYRFKRSADGSQPAAGLIDVKGTLYGTTEYGGASGCDGSGCGTVYSISPTGAEKVLHRFNGHSGGAEPEANLIDVKGSLYGTTSTGGLDCYKPFSCGIVFALKKT